MPSDESTTVGAMLQAARQRQGLSVNDVADRTFIRASLIREIEADHFDGCGSTFYARGHVRSIAVTLGLDTAPVLAEFDGRILSDLPTELIPVYDPAREMPVTPNETRSRRSPTTENGIRPDEPRLGERPADAGTRRGSATTATRPTPTPTTKRAPLPPPAGPPPPLPAQDTSASVPPPDMPGAKSRDSQRAENRSPAWKSALIAAVAVVALLAGASFLIGYTQSPQQPNTSAPLPNNSVSPKPTPSISPSPDLFVGVNLHIRVTSGTSYVKVTSSSGEVLFEGELEAGAVKDFSDPTQLNVRYGNSSVVTVLVNGVNKGSPTCGAIVCTETYELDDGSG